MSRKTITLTLFAIIKRIIASLGFLLSLHTHAFEVTHQARPNSTFETMSLNHSCSTMHGERFSHRCNPGLFSTSDVNGISISLVGKADGDSIDNGRDLIFDPITEPLIRRLFEEKNFNSFTFNTQVTFKNNLFEISYSPYFLLADLFIFNPAFPEISINLINRESVRLSSGKVWWQSQMFKLHAGASLFYYKQTYENTVFSLFDLSLQNPEDLIDFKSEYGVAGDMGFFLENQYMYYPNLSFQVKNIGSNLQENDEFSGSSIRQQTVFLFDTYSTIGIGKDYEFKFGRVDWNIETNFYQFFSEFAVEQTMLGIRYNIRLFSVLLGVGKYYQNLGMRFDSKNFNVGITYTRESDLGSLQGSEEEAVYTGLEINL